VLTVSGAIASAVLYFFVAWLVLRSKSSEQKIEPLPPVESEPPKTLSPEPPKPDTSIRDSDPQLEIKVADLRGKTMSEKSTEQACFDLINRGKKSPAKFACIEDFYVGGYYVAFRNFPPEIRPLGNHDSIFPLYINKPDGKLCDQDIFTLLFWAWEELKNPKLYEYVLPIKATYQDDARDLFETRCELVFYPHEHLNHRLGQKSVTIIETRNQKIRRVAAAITPIDW